MRTNTETRDSRRKATGTEQSPELARDIAALQSLITRGRIEQARRLVKELEARWPESDLMQSFARVLAPPTAQVVAGQEGVSRERSQQERIWLRENAPQYAGHWVILLGDRLIAANSELREAMQQADGQVGPDLGSIHYIPPTGTTP